MEEDTKAYREVYEILKYIPKEESEKVPNGFKKFLEENMDRNYDYEVEHIEDFENQEMLHKTRVILAILYRDYWASQEEKEEILLRDKKQIIEEEEEKRQKYNPDNIFKQDKKVDSNYIEEQMQLIEYKENIFKKILNKLKEWFKFSKSK